MTRELIEHFRKIVKPYMAKQLALLNYENMGEQDKADFERDFDEILDLAIKALETERSEDAISRKAVVELIEGWWLGHTKDDDMSTEIQKLPPVQPEQKVIRCKDCKYVWKEDGYDNLWCNRLTGSFSVDRDGYCAWAKMEEGE